MIFYLINFAEQMWCGMKSEKTGFRKNSHFDSPTLDKPFLKAKTNLGYVLYDKTCNRSRNALISEKGKLSFCVLQAAGSYFAWIIVIF